VRFLGTTTFVVVVLAGVGFLPTRRLAGDEGITSMLAGCLISLISAALAGRVLVTPGPKTPTERMQAAFLAMIVRLVVIVVLAFAAVLSGSFARMPLLFWIAASYIVLLPLEVKLALDAG
jgi:hypothetical protein